jgi:hypothetical protein
LAAVAAASYRERHPMRTAQLPSSPFIHFLRWWVGGLVCVAGLVIAIARGFDDVGWEAMFVLWGAGLSIILMNFLLRVGIEGDTDRDDEQAARAEFQRTGRWPDER